MNQRIDMSVIVPVYNTEKYLSACIDSLLHQVDLRLEVILVNDGSTDRSGSIADQYAQQYSLIKVIHQENRGASAARNAGLEITQGEYIVFVDSDDWVKEDSLCGLYHEATKYQADVVMGSLSYHYPNRFIKNIYNPVPKDFLYIPFRGKEGFVRLVKANAYTPVVWNYLYRREFLEKMQVRFEEGIMFEDELWSPTVLCQASRIVAVDIEFYYYRERGGSVMDSTKLTRRLDSLFCVTDRLIAFADSFEFSGVDKELKSWLYVIIIRLYSRAFSVLSHIKDTSYTLKEHHLDRLWQNCNDIMPETQQICHFYFRGAEANLKKYIDWRTSIWVTSIATLLKAEKKLMLVYNIYQNENLSLKVEDVPADWVITTDRRYIQQADAVVFHLPSLYQILENDLVKKEGQIWVSWYVEPEKDHPLINDPDIRDTFDHQMCYRPNDELTEHPLIRLCRILDGEEKDTAAADSSASAGTQDPSASPASFGNKQ